MKRRMFVTILLFVFAAEIVTLLLFTSKNTNEMQDTVLVNEAVQTVQKDWSNLEKHKNRTGLDYVVLDINEQVLFKTRAGLSESINNAISHRDTILDIKNGSQTVGKLIVFNNHVQDLQKWQKNIFMTVAAALFIQCFLCTGYFIYINHTIQKPFLKLKGFAERIACGNLDIPLTMDRQNIFGAFTESFDIMRSELKKARAAEAKANADKKELVAELSHDIKTPVASIKAAAEVGAALSGNEKIKDNYSQIIRKADQINTLITNLFTATLEELEQLVVTPCDMESMELNSLLTNADYLHRTTVPGIPKCILYTDKLRLQQVFDNIFANSYKYANTKIELSIYRKDNALAVGIEDYGGGIDDKELPLIKEKFKRGNNTENTEGAGLGLYISDYFMKEMRGNLLVENGCNGLLVTVMIPLSGTASSVDL